MDANKSSNNVSIVIPLYYYDLSMECINKLESQIYPGKHEFIFVCDNPKKEVRKEFYSFKDATIIKHEKNIGLAKSYNDGIKHAKYENVLLFHEDCVPKDINLILNMIAKMNEGYEVVNSRIIITHKLFNKVNFWGKMMLFRYVNRVTQGLGKTSMFKKSVFDRIGFFDGDTFRTSGEDCEYWRRMEKNGIKVVQIKDIVDHNHHVLNSTLWNVIKKEIQMGEAHGVMKRLYPWKRIGIFDLEYRVLCLIIALIGLCFGGDIALYSFMWLITPAIAMAAWQAIKNLHETNWFFGSVVYMFIGPIIYFVQTYSAIKSFITGKQTI